MSYVIGVDVGGTNTDTAILCQSQVIAKGKKPTTEDKTSGVVDSIKAAFDQLCNTTGKHKVEKSEVLRSLARVSIGTTHFTNAINKRDGRSLERVAVIRLCGCSSRALPPFSDFPGELKELMFGGVYMLNGGLEYDRKEISAVDEEEVRQCVRQILKEEPPVKHVVISGVFAPCDDPCGKQEREVEKIVKEECPQLSCTLSHELLGMLGLLERENAAVMNESLKELAQVTVEAFQEALTNLEMQCPFFLTQNDGTMISAEEAKKFPVLTFSSGPTNSMRGAAFLSGLSDGIVVDIGGTTTDVGVLRNGFPRESSAHCMIGGVRTNFCMPDVQSIALGGGTHVNWNQEKGSVKLGPNSVEYRIRQEALCFGGKTCTTTDVALAAGVAPQDFCETPESLSVLSPRMVYAAMREMRRMMEEVIDSMKTDKEDVPAILVGGGCILIDGQVPLKGASRVIIPESHWDVANAVGAALGTVGGISDIVVNLGPIKEALKGSCDPPDVVELEHKSREVALRRARDTATDEVINKIKKATGGITDSLRQSVYINSEEMSDITYVEDRVRVRVKAIGALTSQDAAVALPGQAVMDHSGPGEPARRPEAVHQSSKNNPNWPFSSAEDKMKDIAANLPLPELIQSEDGQGSSEWVLSIHDVECLALGAGILGCGGGGDPNNGRLRAIKLLKDGKQVKILNPCKVDTSKMGLVCGVGFMGAPVILIEKLVGGDETHLALTRLQQVLASGVVMLKEGGKEDLKKVDTSSVNIPLSHRITGLMCLEAGGCNSIEPILLGAKTDLPVLDVDGMGRAFPELQMYVPFIYGASHCPSSLTDCKGEAMTCSYVASSLELEKFFRVETVRMGMSSGLATGVMDYQTMLSKAVLFTMSQAWQLGRAVMRARLTHSPVLTAVAEQQNGLVLITGKLVNVDRESGAGFTKVVCIVEGLEEFAGNQVKIHAKNENYVAQKVGMKGEELDVLACTPDLISVVDSNTGAPVTTEEVRYGLRVGVVVLPANPVLKTSQALKVVGPRAFGFDMDYREPKPLLGIKQLTWD